MNNRRLRGKYQVNDNGEEDYPKDNQPGIGKDHQNKGWFDYKQSQSSYRRRITTKDGED